MDARALPLHDRRGDLGAELQVQRRGSARGPCRRAAAAPAARSPSAIALQRAARVGDDAQRDGPGHADVARVDVDLDQALGRRVPPVAVEGNVEVAHPRADDEHDVGLGAREVAGRAEAEDVGRMVARNRRPAGHGRDDRAAELLDDVEQGLVGAPAVDAGAGEDERPLGARQQRDGLGDLRLGRLRPGAAVARGRRDRHRVRVAGLVDDRRRAGRCGPVRVGRSTTRGTRGAAPRGCARAGRSGRST